MRKILRSMTGPGLPEFIIGHTRIKWKLALVQVFGLAGDTAHLCQVFKRMGV